MAPERQIRELIKCLNRLQQVPDYIQPLVQVMDAALAHVNIMLSRSRSLSAYT